jgi:hypothetical protein
MRAKGLVWLLAAVLCLFPPGCSVAEQQRIDTLTDQVEQLTIEGEKFLDSEIAQMLIPPNVDGAIRLGGALSIGLIMAWRKWRKNNTLTKVTRSIVQGIDASGNQGQTCKLQIAKAMQKNKVYRQGKEIVRDFKNGSTTKQPT